MATTIADQYPDETLGAYYCRLHINLGISYYDIATALNVPQNRVWATANKYLQRQREKESTSTEIPDSIILDQAEPILIISEGVAVTSDWHVPGHSKLMLERLCEVAEREGIDDLVVIGDIYDFSSISRFPHNQKEVTVGDVVKAGGQVMRPVFNRFKRVFITSGNHDERLAKALGDDFDLQLLINASFGKEWPDCDVIVSNLDYLYLNDTWILGHPSNYSGQAAKTPLEYADLYQRNVVTGHNHIVGLGQSKSGKYIGIDTGAMIEEKAHYYHKRRMNKFTRWSNGFTIIKNNYARLYTEKFTEWVA